MAPAQAQVKVIFDTDMDLDVDDAGALAVLNALADNGEAEILGVILDSPSQRHGNSRLGVASISAINTYYGRGGTPIGDLPPSEYMNNPPHYSRYRSYASTFGDPGDGSTSGYVYYNEYIKSHFANNNVAGVFNATTLYRKLLAGAPDGSVTIISVGLLRALNDLMYTTSADGYSSLSGKQLIAKKVKHLVCMSGLSSFSSTYRYDNDFNWDRDGLGDAERITKEWPTPIVVMPLGSGINTGARLTTETPTSNPVRKSYELFRRSDGISGKSRSSWDQLAVIYGVRGTSTIFTEKKGKNIDLFWKGDIPAYVSTPLYYAWNTATSADKPDILLGKNPNITDGQVAVIVEDLMVQGPKPKYAGYLEAESATLSGPVVSTSLPGYSGTGFADYAHTTGDYIEWTINNPFSSSKNVSLRFFYTNGSSANRPLKLTINGTQVGSNLPFANTGSWSNWQPQTAAGTFAPGTNRVRLTVTGVNGPNMDYMAFEMLQAGTLQAEDAVLGGTSFDQVNAGYTGSGYVKFNGGIGNTVEWTIDKANASQVNLKFRYTNGHPGNRPLQLSVNGVVIASSLAFDVTGSWTTWDITDGINANFVAGTNKVRLTSTGTGNCNLDYLSFTSSPSSSPANFSMKSAPAASAPAPLSAGSS